MGELPQEISKLNGQIKQQQAKAWPALQGGAVVLMIQRVGFTGATLGFIRVILQVELFRRFRAFKAV